MRYNFNEYTEIDLLTIEEALSYYFIDLRDQIPTLEQWVDKAIAERKAEQCEEVFAKIAKYKLYSYSKRK